MKTTLLLVRHGQSLGNLREVFLGSTDLGLTPLGERQAAALCDRLLGVKIDAVYSSDLSRAMGTVLPTAKSHGLAVTTDVRLREIFAGEWEGVSFDEIACRYPEDRALWKQNIGLARPTGGESVAELCDRVMAVLKEIAERHPGQCVLVGTHATPIRGVSCLLRHLPPEEMTNIPWVKNGSITTVVYEDRELRLVEMGNEEHLAGVTNEPPSKV